MMRIRRLLFFMVTVLSCTSLWGQDGFNPASPPEPMAPPTKLVINVEPADGGNVNGEGRHVPGTTVNVHAYNNANFVFQHWTDADGTVVSTSTDYSFEKGDGTETLTAHFVYSPGSPAEPVPGTALVYYHLKLEAGEGGYVSGGGKYRQGTSVHLKANCNQYFEFAGWSDESGETISTSASFDYIKKEGNEVLKANFVYNPDSPEHPSEPVLSHNINLTTTDGGRAWARDTRLKEGETTLVEAYCNTGYKFAGWYLNGELYTALSSFSCTMGKSDVDFEARFEFDPDSPSEPQQASDKKYSLYFMTEITYPGTTIDCPLFLTSLDDVYDMTFNVTFPEGINPLLNTAAVDPAVEGYTMSITETAEANVYLVSLIGGKVPGGNTRLLNIQLEVPENVTLNQSYQVKLNQVSVTQADGTTVTALTRNGRVQIFALGDTNGDGSVNVTDRVNIVKFLLNGAPGDDSFIPEVSDVSGDGGFSITDGVGIVDIILKENK